MNIVIVGGGFGGVRAARLLARQPKFKITLISEQRDFVYHAALPNAITGSTKHVSLSLGKIFAAYPNVRVVHDSIRTIDAERKTVSGHGDYAYDELVLALGSKTTFFGTRGAAEHAYGTKTLEDIERFTQRIADDVKERKRLDTNYVIVGAGATGVEIAGALSTHIARLKSAHAVKDKAAVVRLVEAGPTILPRFSATARKKVLRRLRSIGVQVSVNQHVDSVSDDEVLIDDTKLPTHSVIWTSGTVQHPLFTAHGDIFTFTASGRVKVTEHLQAAPHISVIGDSAATKYAGLATTALNDATFIARSLAAKSHHRNRPPYRPVLFPSVIAVDSSWAYVETTGVYIVGFLGHLCRRLLELQVLVTTLGWANGLQLWRKKA